MKESLELADLGDTLRSESELLRLLEAYRRTPLSLESVEGTLALISVQNNLALCHYEQGRLHSAETLLRHCINQYHRSILHFTPLSLRPFLFAVHGNGDRREGRGNKSRDKGSGPLKREYLYLLFNLANVLSRLERFEEAEALYLFCLEQIEISYFPSSGPSEDEREQEQEEGKGACHDQDHLSILSNLAILYANQRTLSSSSGDSYGFLAEKLFRECLSKRGEVLWMILADRDVYRQKIASARLREKQQRQQQQQQQQQWSKVRGNGKGKGRTEEDILRRDEVYSLDPEHGQGEGQRQKQRHGLGWESEESEVGSEETDDEEEKQYELLYRHSSILWLRSLFNLTCHLIETQAQTHSSGHGPHSRPLDPCPLTLEEALEECLQRSRELLHGDERKEFIERVRLLRKRLQLQVQQRQRQRRERQELRSLWGNIYSGGGERHRDGWGEVVMDAEKWFESSFSANASSASPRFPFFSLPGKDLEKEMERSQSEGNNGKEQRQEEGEEGRLGSDSESEN
jgi:tetratricopeptide (TPR) repeat protein